MYTFGLQLWFLEYCNVVSHSCVVYLQVVVEFEGVVVEDTSDLHSRAWVQLAEDEGKSRPLQFALKRAEGMKNDQVGCSAIWQAAVFSLSAQFSATPSAAPMPSISESLAQGTFALSLSLALTCYGKIIGTLGHRPGHSSRRVIRYPSNSGGLR